MANAISVSGPISQTDRTLSFETGKLAQLADGAVVGRIGSKLADSILSGNMKEFRNQVVVHFPNINRQYKDHHFNNR